MGTVRAGALLSMITAVVAWAVANPMSLQGQEIPSREDRELVQAAVNIGMNEQQRLQFRRLIAEFIQDYRSSMLKITRGHNATGIERKMDRKHQSLLVELDEKMALMLTPAQQQRYVFYRDRLSAALSGRSEYDPGAYLNLEVPPDPHH